MTRTRPFPGVLLAVALVLVACSDDDTVSGPSEDPPWGLTGIDMPDTEGEVIAVLEAMPVIDGRRPTILRNGETSVPYGVAYVDGESWDAGMTAARHDPPEDLTVAVRGVAEAYEAEGITVEASALDPNGHLVWVAATDDENYALMWADPEGSWIFSIQGDSAQFRTKMVHAFITAAGG